MNEEQMRKEFEEWCVNNNLPCQSVFGQYCNDTTSTYWMVWRSSRNAMKPIKFGKDIEDSVEIKRLFKLLEPNDEYYKY